MDTNDDVNYLCRMVRKDLRKLRYKCRRHNADYYTDSAIPDTSECRFIRMAGKDFLPAT